MAGRDREQVRESERTTIIREGGDRSGMTAVGVIAAVFLIIVLLLILFSGWFGDRTNEITIPNQVDIDLNIVSPVPPAEAPQAESPAPATPDSPGADNPQ